MERDFLSMGVPAVPISYYGKITWNLDNECTTLSIPMNVFCP